MWIKSEDGKLYNLDHAYSIGIVQKGEAWEIVAKFALPPNQECILASAKTVAEATTMLEKIKAVPLCGPAQNWEFG